MPWDPLPVTRTLACTAGACALPVPVPIPLAAPTHADRAPLRSLRFVAARLGALLAPLRVLPVPLPIPCSLSRLAPPAALPLPLASAPFPRFRPRSLPRVPWLAPCVCPWALRLLGPVPCSALPWPAPCPACAPSPPSWITRRASCCRGSYGSLTPGGERSGARGRTCRVRPVGKAALGANGLGGLEWVLLGLVWARYFAPSLPLAAAAAAPREAPGARAGSVPSARGMPGAAAWPAGAVARLAGAAVSTPRPLSPPPSAAVVAPGEARVACAGAHPALAARQGAAVGAAARLVGAAVSAPCAPGAPSRGGAAGLAAWAAEAVS